jgi:uncharacterized protein (DUF58 family)
LILQGKQKRSDTSADNLFHTLTQESRTLAESLPELRMEASRIAASITAGWHGRRRSGPGETFWQYRTFTSGEPANRIDWRRSARDDTLYVRETEWEAAHTIRFGIDLSPSMQFQSHLAQKSKRDRAVLLGLALAGLLVKGGERVALLGGGHARTGRLAIDKICERLLDADGENRPFTKGETRAFEDVILISDFLDDNSNLDAQLQKLSDHGAHMHLVQIIDPVEETFPFRGRTRFEDPETGQSIIAGNAESWSERYRSLFKAHKERLSDITKSRNWSYTVHHTDQAISHTLLTLHAILSERIK